MQFSQARTAPALHHREHHRFPLPYWQFHIISGKVFEHHLVGSGIGGHPVSKIEKQKQSNSCE
jgi:hypothetical protein